MVIGWFGSDLLDDAGNSLSDAWNAAVDAVPGARDVADAIDSVVTGPVRDFAHTAIGRVVLTAMASSLTGALAPILGPQLMTVAFALPGMAAGDDFLTAWTQEFASRVQKTADIMGADVVPDVWTDQLNKLNAYLQESGVDLTKIDFHALAQAAGVRDDVAAWAVSGATGTMADYVRHVFDPKTGKDLGIGTNIFVDLERRAQQAARAALIAYVRTIQEGQLRRGATYAMFGGRENLLVSNVVAAARPAVLPATVLPGGVFATGAPPTSAKKTGDVVLGFTLAAAAVALVYHFTR